MLKYVFGPVPSRRLGKSLGVNNIPPKICSYSCVYCQLGRTIRYSIDRKKYYPPNELAEEVVRVVNKFKRRINVITFVPDGEPTLDINLGKSIELIKSEVTKKIAVITNSSLINREDVTEDLMNSDIISLKVDAVDENIFKKINRPHPKLRLEDILDGIKNFRKVYKGKIYTETMFVKGLNDSIDHIMELIEYIKSVKPNKAFIAVPTRPPAEPWVKPGDPKNILHMYNKLSRYMPNRVELLNYIEEGRFGLGKVDPIEEFVNIVSVHPMKIDYAYKFFEERGLNPEKTLKILIDMGDVILIKYEGIDYVMRKLITRRVSS